MELVKEKAVVVEEWCPKCGGNIIRDFDPVFGWYPECLQCGRPLRQEIEQPDPRLGGKK
ncbi:hypothetical protein LCGC14_0420270 [marine sediment metagenome]|uniref:Uncharacterized protein n=1 Tax=marine sediment metagenome TaxID=412755 RepID=A0A0F9W073_9ZZZZ